MPRRSQEEANHGHDPRPKKQTAAGQQNPPPHLAQSAFPVLEQPTHAEVDPLVWFATQDQGYLRLVSKDAGKAYYLKYKWTVGAYADKYVMVVCWDLAVLYHLGLLRQKVELVEAGVLRPISDKWMG